MKRVKTVLALGVAATISAPVMANEYNFYGRANLAFQISDDGEGSFSEVKANDDSRLGVAGDYALNDSLDVIFKMEFFVDMDGDTEGSDVIKQRNQYIGLKGDFGTLMLGKRDTVLKNSYGKIDVFNDHEGDIKKLWEGENRTSDSVTYFTPKFGDFQAGVSYIAEGDVDGESGVSASVTYGDIKLKKSKFYAAIAIDDEVDGHDLVRVAFTSKVADVTLGLMVQTQEELDTGVEMDGYVVSAAYKLNEYTLRAQLQTADYDDVGDQNGVGIGIDYNIAKNTRIYVNYNTYDMATQADKEYFSSGIAYTF